MSWICECGTHNPESFELCAGCRNEQATHTTGHDLNAAQRAAIRNQQIIPSVPSVPATDEELKGFIQSLLDRGSTLEEIAVKTEHSIEWLKEKLK